MKKYLLFIIFIVGACTAEQNNQNPQDTVPTTASNKEKKVLHNPENHKNEKSKDRIEDQPIAQDDFYPPNIDNFYFPDEFDYSSHIPDDFCQTTNPNCIREKIFPIGWSKDGKLAFLLQTTNFGVDLLIKLVVKDLVEDKDIFKQRWADEHLSLKDFWEKEKLLIGKILKDSQIQPRTSQVEFKEFPFDNNDYEYEAKLISYGDKNELIIRTSSEKAKSVYKNRHSDMEFGLKKTNLLGFVKSPFEERIAIVLLNEIHGMESEITLSINFTGCHLSKGFK